MKVSTLLAASVVLVALVLLVGSASAGIDTNLKEVLDHSDNFWNLSITKGYFVEDVKHLRQSSKCGGAFFCKAYDIMLHNNFSTLVEEKLKEEKELPKHNLRKYLREEEKLMDNFKVYTSKVNCSMLLDDVKPTNATTQLNVFFNHLSSCIRNHNLKG